MKYLSIIILALFLGSTSYGQADAIDSYFSQYKDDERFTMVYVSPKMFQMLSKVGAAAEEDIDPEIINMVSNLKGLKILTTEENASEIYEEAISKINTSMYDELMTVRSEGDNVKFLVRDSDGGNIVQELLLLVGGDEFVMMSFVGDIDLRLVGKLAKTIDMKGANHLEKLDNK